MNEIMTSKSDKVKSITPNETGGLDYVLVNGTKLGEINQDLPFLPNGIINKGVTGIGATTMEIEAPRHSIIIEPLKVTVKQKSEIHPNIFAYNQDKSTAQSKSLQKYIENEAIVYKKIILVIDRLEALIYDLGERVTEYFFLFDEIDYMQGSSTYRDKMETGLDLGKALDNFALVSATHIGFTDPEIKELKVYNFSYFSEKLNDVNLYYLTNVPLNKNSKQKATLNRLFSCIVHGLKTMDSKILVAINNVKLIDELSEALIKHGALERENISLHISVNTPSNERIKRKFSNLDIENCKLPTRLNFITSAYFNGYDLFEEDLSIIIYSSPNFKTNVITANEMKQIYGRNRIDNGNTSFFIFTHDIQESELKDAELLYSTDTNWYERGQMSVDMQNCIDKHLKKLFDTDTHHKFYTSTILELTQNLPLNLSRKKRKFNKENFLEVFFNPLLKKEVTQEVSYLQIDYFKHYYKYLKDMYVFTESERIEQLRLKGKNASTYNPAKYRFINSLRSVGFSELEIKLDIPLIKYIPETSTHNEQIINALNEVLIVIKDKKKNKKSGLSLINKKVLDILLEGKQYYSLTSLISTIRNLQSLDELDGLLEYVQHENFKKSSVYNIINGLLDNTKTYEMEKLIEVGQSALGSILRKTALKSKSIKTSSLILIRLVFETSTKHKPNSKGDKLILLTRRQPFNELVRNKKKKKLYSLRVEF
jgi:hypothetical protein